MLVGYRQAEAAREFAGLRLAAFAERKPQQIELVARGGEQEIALVALFLARPVERAPTRRQCARRNVVAGRQNLGAQFARGRQQVAELDRHVAIDARHRRFARAVTLGETVDHHLLEAALVVEHVMRNADALGHRTGIVDVLPGAASALAMGRRAMIIELQGDADDVVTLGLEQRRGHRRVHAARHRDDDARRLRQAFDIERIEHQRCGPVEAC